MTAGANRKRNKVITRACQAVVGAAVSHSPAMTLSFHVQGNWSLEGTLISPSGHRLDGQTGFSQGCLTPKPTSLTTWLHCPSGAAEKPVPYESQVPWLCGSTCKQPFQDTGRVQLRSVGHKKVSPCFRKFHNITTDTRIPGTLTSPSLVFLLLWSDLRWTTLPLQDQEVLSWLTVSVSLFLLPP